MSYPIRLSARASLEEDAAISLNAKAAGLTRSRYLAEAGAGRRITPAVPKTDAAMLSELRKIGGLVRLLVDHGQTADANEIHQRLLSLRAAIDGKHS